MSFSSDIKEEILAGFSKKQKDCCIKAETFGEYLTQVHNKYDLDEFKQYWDIGKIDECCLKAILKGIFLGAGCIVEPNLDYHFEVITKNKACADYIFNLLSVLDFTPKILKRKSTNSYTIYMKESEQISIFLSMVGASQAMLYFEQVRVEKDVKNNINRTINCETANIAKTIKTSVKQIEAIQLLKEKDIFHTLNDKLKETANLRLQYPEDSLEALSNRTQKTNYISKSGLKHRLDKIVALANDLQS